MLPTHHPISAVSDDVSATPIGFLPLRRFSWLSPLFPGLPHPICSTFRFSKPLSGLLLCQPEGFVSCLVRPWGLPFRGFPSRQSVLLSEPFPSCRWKSTPIGCFHVVQPTGTNACKSARHVPSRLQGFPLTRVRSPAQCCYPLCRAVPLLFQPSRDFPPVMPAREGLLPCASACLPGEPRRQPCTTEFQVTTGLAGLP